MKIHFFDVNTDIYVTKEALMFQLLVQMGASSEKQEIFIQQDTLIQLMRHHDAPSVDTAQLLSTDFVKSEHSNVILVLYLQRSGSRS